MTERGQWTPESILRFFYDLKRRYKIREKDLEGLTSIMLSIARQAMRAEREECAKIADNQASFMTGVAIREGRDSTWDAMSSVLDRFLKTVGEDGSDKGAKP